MHVEKKWIIEEWYYCYPIDYPSRFNAYHMAQILEARLDIHTEIAERYNEDKQCVRFVILTKNERVPH